MQDRTLVEQISFAIARKLLSACVAHSCQAASTFSHAALRSLLLSAMQLPAHHLEQICSYLLELGSLDHLLTALPAELHRHIVDACVVKHRTDARGSSTAGHQIVKVSTQAQLSYLAASPGNSSGMSSRAAASLLMQAVTFPLTDLHVHSMAADATAVVPLCAALSVNTLTRVDLVHAPLLADACMADMLCSALQRLSGSLRQLKLSWCGPVHSQAHYTLAAAMATLKLEEMEFASCKADEAVSFRPGARCERASMLPGAVALESAAHTPLRQVTWTIDDGQLLSSLARFKQLVDVHIELAGPVFHGACYPDTWPDLPALTSLALGPSSWEVRNSRLICIRFFPVGRLVNLQRLMLWGIDNQIDEDSASFRDGSDAKFCGLQGLRYLTHLQQLVLSAADDHMDTADIKAFAAAAADSLQYLKRLHSLRLESTLALPDGESEYAHGVAALPALRALRCQLFQGSLLQPPAGMPAPQHLQQLTSLDVALRKPDANTAATRSLFAAVNALPQLLQLRMQQLDRAHAEHGVAMLLNSVTALTALHQLVLVGFNIRERDEWAPLQHFPRLTRLELQCMQRRNASVRSDMAPIASLPQLQFFGIRHGVWHDSEPHSASACTADYFHTVSSVQQWWPWALCDVWQALRHLQVDVDAPRTCIEDVTKLLRWAGASCVKVIELRINVQHADMRAVCETFNAEYAGRKQCRLVEAGALPEATAWQSHGYPITA